MTPPREVTEVHTRLLRCALGVEDARAYWGVADPGSATGRADRAFAAYWFGARSHARVEVLLANLRVRFDAFPEGLEVLRNWPEMDPDTRVAICHWHLQLADPLYRAFTGDYFPARRASGRTEVMHDRVVAWVGEQDAGRWTMSTRLQFASKLLSAAREAGLVASSRDPRPLRVPRIPDDALAYLLHLLRGVNFAGTLLDNPYLRSVGLEGEGLAGRLATLQGVRFQRQADLRDLAFDHSDLAAWFTARSAP